MKFSHINTREIHPAYRACCKRRTGPDWTGLDWTGETRTESVFYKSRAAICKRRTHLLNALRMNGRSKILSILMTKFNVFTEKVFDDHLVVSKLGSGCSTD